MSSLIVAYLLIVCIRCQIEDKLDAAQELLEHEFPHHQFPCSQDGYLYETEFTFLRGLGHGFVHAEPYRIYFEYYFTLIMYITFLLYYSVITSYSVILQVAYIFYLLYIMSTV